MLRTMVGGFPKGTQGKFVLGMRGEFESSPSTRWYQDVTAEHNTFYIEVVEWVWKKLNEAQYGDAVNLFFQCPGTEKGITLGKKIPDNMLVLLLRGFQNGMFNAIGSRCHPEYLPKAARKDKQSNQYVVTGTISPRRYSRGQLSVSTPVALCRITCFASSIHG